MSRLQIVTDIDAPVTPVWRALTAPAEVEQWDGAVPADVPDDYPKPGQVAVWHLDLWGRLVREIPLYDRIRRVEPERLLQSDITYLFVRIDETYALSPGPAGDHITRLLTVALIDSPVAALTVAAEEFAPPAIRGAMARLKRHCEA